MLTFNFIELNSSKIANYFDTKNKKLLIEIPVRMGSHKFLVQIYEDMSAAVNVSYQPPALSTHRLVDLCLKKCKLSGSSRLYKTYGMFESVCGVERLLKSKEDMISLMNKWSAQNMSVEFVVRKFKANTSLNENDKINQDLFVKKCYKKLRESTNKENFPIENNSAKVCTNMTITTTTAKTTTKTTSIIYEKLTSNKTFLKILQQQHQIFKYARVVKTSSQECSIQSYKRENMTYSNSVRRESVV